jgi:uncharacterized protein YjbI with pentapeptide repeats
MSPQVEAALIAGIVSLISLSGTVAVAVIGFRTTRSVTGSTLAEQRTRTLNERFATAADRLGSDKPPAVQLAGVYAMAGLADDWPENRQICVDVLCAYLRMPYEPDPGDEASEPERLAFRAGREVRHTVIRVITAHLQDGATNSWQGLNFDFTGVVFDGGTFAGAIFSGMTSCRSAVFSGGTVDFAGAKFSGGKVNFASAKFAGDVNFAFTEFTSGEVNFSNAEFSRGVVFLAGAKFSGSEVGFGKTRFSGGEVDFGFAEFSSGTVHFGGHNFGGAVFSDGKVNFARAKFRGSVVDFGLAKFSGGEVDFSNPGDWSVPPKFPWTDEPPPGVKLPEKEDQSQA